MDTKEQQTEPAKKPRRFPVIPALIVLAAAVVAVVYILGPGKAATQPAPTPSSGPVFAPNAAVGALPGKTEEEIQDMLNQKVTESTVAFTVNAVPWFADGSSEGDLMLESPANNINNIEFTIKRDDTGEVLYKSGLLVPNQYIEKDKLQTETPLPAGKYPCTVDIILYDPETNEAKGMTSAGINITIES